ncbi:MAG: hypothetical protein JKY41_01175 [Rhodobacteraceae bacterium]|nr:hypothetical protein [Paracoccaceae bacterium]
MKYLIFIGLLVIAIIGGKSMYLSTNSTEVISPSRSAADYNITVLAEPLTDTIIAITVNTNIPLPIKVALGVSLKGQNPEDIYIGYSEQVTLRTSEQSLTINTFDQKLPTADYIAEVSFYPAWGAIGENVEASQISGKVYGSASLRLVGTGESVLNATRRDKLQIWVIDNVIVGTDWNETRFVSQLGNFDELVSDLRVQNSYYFPDADMTIIVNRFQGESGKVATWRMGLASR